MTHVDDASILPVRWWKSSASGAVSDCVEVGIIGDDGEVIAVRDSKRPTGPALLFDYGQMRGLVAAIRSGGLGQGVAV
ncbi:DUF397 domain-containing protein [Streptomyces sp. NPDC046261]|uniref:DUF397 domain-containing protein n=1 Tax=Streptomyces sp. NPDC046261 TaxID=3157200 RepID=UPI0033F32788